MNQEMKKMLQDAFEAPEPQNKREFLRRISRTRSSHTEITHIQFFLTQASYIRKWVWALSLGIFLIALIGACFMEKDVLWLLSAMMPFLAITAITENIRSEIYGMSELEMATRFSLKSVVLARMGILGIVHLVVLCLITLLGYREGAITVFQTGVYLLVPYLLTDAGGLWLVRKIRGKEAVYASMGLAFLVGVLPIASKYTMTWLYQAKNFSWWLVVLVVLIGVIVSEWRKNMKRMEELEWNLS